MSLIFLCIDEHRINIFMSCYWVRLFWFFFIFLFNFVNYQKIVYINILTFLCCEWVKRLILWKLHFYFYFPFVLSFFSAISTLTSDSCFFSSHLIIFFSFIIFLCLFYFVPFDQDLLSFFLLNQCCKTKQISQKKFNIRSF